MKTARQYIRGIQNDVGSDVHTCLIWQHSWTRLFGRNPYIILKTNQELTAGKGRCNHHMSSSLAEDQSCAYPRRICGLQINMK